MASEIVLYIFFLKFKLSVAMATKMMFGKGLLEDHFCKKDVKISALTK